MMGDWVLAICTAIGAVTYLYADSRLPQLQVGDPMGPQVFPALIGIGLLASALLLIAETWRKRRPADASLVDASLVDASLVDASLVDASLVDASLVDASLVGAAPRPDTAASSHQLILVGMVLWTALYYLAFEPLGYLLSTLVYMLALLAVFNRGRWWVNAACALGFTVVAYAVFTRFLQVALPPGVFGV